MKWRCGLANTLPLRQRRRAMQLTDYIKAEGISLTTLAKEWGIAPSTLSRNAQGKRWPSEIVLVRSHQRSGGRVSLPDWIETCRTLLESQGIIANQEDQNGKD